MREHQRLGARRRARWTAALAALGLAAAGGALVAPPVATAAPSSGFHTLSPVRLVDTRLGNVPLVAGVERPVTVAGVGGVPADATRGAVRVSFSDAVGVGELYVHPCGSFDPAGRFLLEVVPTIVDTGLALPALQAGGFCVTSTVATHLIVDVEGYEAPGAGGAAFVATPEALVLDGATTGAGDTLAVTFAGAHGIPVGATAVSYELIMGGPAAGYATVYACGIRPLASTLSHPAGRAYGTAGIGEVDSAGRMCIYTFGASTLTLRVFGYWAPGASPTAEGPYTLEFEQSTAPGFEAITPVRAFDTRSGGGKMPEGGIYTLDLSAVVPVEATDVVINVTVTDTEGPGFVTVWPCAAERPLASNLNYVTGQTVPNLVTVALDEEAHVCLFTSQAAHLLGDLAGWYVAGGGDGLVSRTPSRLFDTRSAGGPLATGATYALDLTGKVDADASAVVMNVTVTEAKAGGYVTVWPCAADRPLASNLNFVAGQTVPNLVTVAVGADHRVCFYTSGATHLLADLAAWYSPSSSVGYVGLVPDRSFDTRDDDIPVQAGETIRYAYGRGDVGAVLDQVVAVVLNVTAVEPAAAGFLTVFPCSAGRPTASNVNFVRGDVVPNAVIVAVDEDDKACFYSHAVTDIVADLAGYFTELPFRQSIAVR